MVARGLQVNLTKLYKVGVELHKCNALGETTKWHREAASSHNRISKFYASPILIILAADDGNLFFS